MPLADLRGRTSSLERGMDRFSHCSRDLPRAFAFRLGSLLVRFNIGAQDGIHAGEMALAALLEPFDDIGVEAQMNRCFAARHDNARVLPKIFAQRFGRRRVSASLILPARAHRADLAK